jgi:hypothetical protein
MKRKCTNSARPYRLLLVIPVPPEPKAMHTFFKFNIVFDNTTNINNVENNLRNGEVQ